MNNRGSRIGVIGSGALACKVVQSCAELDVLAAVCDSNEDALQELRSRYSGVATYRDPEELLLAPIDAVAVATPAHLHAQLALRAISAGKHVFVETPLALTVEDAKRVAEGAERSQLQVFVGHLLLHHPAIRRMRALLAQGAIGRIWHVRSRRLSLGELSHAESVWWSLAPHDLAIALAIFGEEPVGVVAAQAGWLTPRLPDTAYADFQFSQGRSAHIEVGWLEPQKSLRLDVYGTQGVITIDNSSTACRMMVAPCGARPDERGMLTTWSGPAQDVEVEQSEALREEIVAFLTSVRFGIPAETDAKEGLAVVRALAMADAACSRSYAPFEVIA